MNIPDLRQRIKDFLKEDIGAGDITSEAVFSSQATATARMCARHDMIACGFETVIPLVFNELSPKISCEQAAKDGNPATSGNQLLIVHGPTLPLLQAERLALNLAQRLCGIATLTNKFVDRVKGLPVKIVDTRKTTPGLRDLEKYAVRVGGGSNHRFNLADGVLIKDNHIAACGSIKLAVEAVRNRIPHTMKIEVETDTIDQVEECLECGVDIIMLDNMELEILRQAVKLINGNALVEASGGVNLEKVRQIAETGVDIISVGALTHSAPACDIGLDFT